MSSIQFEELTMYYTHGKNDMSNQNNCEWLYFQKPQRWYLKNFKSHSGALVSRQVSSLLRGLAAPFALWVALQSIQPANLLSLGCKGESFSKKTSETQSRNWNRSALYNLFHSHWWEENCRTTGRREKYISLCCTFNRSYFVFCF